MESFIATAASTDSKWGDIDGNLAKIRSTAEAGELGCIPADTFGREFAAAVAALEEGQYCRPVETQWGFHVIRRETMTDEDIAGVVEREYTERKSDETIEMLRKSAKVRLMTQTASARK